MEKLSADASSYKYLILLSILCATFLHLGLLFQSDIISIGSTYVSATIFVYPLTCIILDMISEVYGYKTARQTLWSVIIANLIFGTFTALSTKPQAPAFWISYDHIYDQAMSPIFRTAFVGIGSIIVGQFINLYALTKLRALTKGRYFAMRSMTSTIIGDTLTIAIALSINFDAKMQAGSVVTIITNELIIMYAFAILFSFPASIIANCLKNYHGINHIIDFNPFKKQTSTTNASPTS